MCAILVEYEFEIIFLPNSPSNPILSQVEKIVNLAQNTLYYRKKEIIILKKGGMNSHTQMHN